jgi:hypothetical protein
LQPGPFDWNDTVGFVIKAYDRVSVDIFCLADEFADYEFTPIVLGWCAIRGVPRGGGLYLRNVSLSETGSQIPERSASLV